MKSILLLAISTIVLAGSIGGYANDNDFNAKSPALIKDAPEKYQQNLKSERGATIYFQGQQDD
ncbi:hypothetical protein [Facilibium subflavum]|uniref:hypothetical protein n=1 Tax=Facilibium subflavum TaxID=2219058 RepID=UPI000E65680A|nr:hypothetical protein [Facilibium subflavum]